MFVSFQASIDMIRAKQMIQDKAQTADNGWSLLRAVTPYWVISNAPFGRAGKRSFAVLRLWARTCHCRRAVPSAQPLPDSLNTAISPLRSTRLKGDQPGCAVKSGDKPAAVLFVFLAKTELHLHTIETIKQSSKI